MIFSAALRTAAAQTVSVTPPFSMVLPNYERLPIGAEEGLEGGAFVARARGPSANWYNPAGLAVVDQAIINASLNGYELTTLGLENFDRSLQASNFNDLPGFVGLELGPTILHVKGLGLGLSVGRRIGWNGTINIGGLVPTAAGEEGILYQSASVFTVTLPQAGVGYVLNDHWRIGATLGLALTDFTRAVTLSEQLSTTTLETQLRTSLLHGRALDIVASAGVQAAFAKRWQAGLQVKTPGLRLAQNGSIAYEAVQVSGPQCSSAILSDGNAHFGYRVPLQVSAGLSVRGSVGSVELDASYYNALGNLALLKSGTPVLVTTATAGQPAQTTTVPSPEVIYNTRSVVNAELGGDLNVGKAVVIRAGAFTDFSPAASSSGTAFQQINLYGLCLGVSVTGAHFGASFGGIYELGQSPSFSIGESLLSTPIKTSLSVHTFSLLYALQYRF